MPLVIKIAPDLSDESIEALAAVFSETGIGGVITTDTTITRDASQVTPSPTGRVD